MSEGRWRRRLLFSSLLILVAAVLLLQPFSALGSADVLAPSPGQAIRFHIIPNSNSASDEALKLAVRSAVLPVLQDRLASAPSFEDALSRLQALRPRLKALTQAQLSRFGSSETVRVQIGSADFPAKEIGGDLFPAGRYTALEIVLGQGKGQNWWCVLFPPLCLTGAASGEGLSEPASPLVPTQLRAGAMQFGLRRPQKDTMKIGVLVLLEHVGHWLHGHAG